MPSTKLVQPLLPGALSGAKVLLDVSLVPLEGSDAPPKFLLREALWKRYRFWYLAEENVPYDEGQSLMETCCWQLSEQQIYNLQGSPEL